VKVTAHQTSTLEAFFHISPECTSVMKLDRIGPRDTDDVFKVMTSKVKVTDKIFQKVHFSGGVIPID